MIEMIEDGKMGGMVAGRVCRWMDGWMGTLFIPGSKTLLQSIHSGVNHTSPLTCEANQGSIAWSASEFANQTNWNRWGKEFCRGPKRQMFNLCAQEKRKPICKTVFTPHNVINTGPSRTKDHHHAISTACILLHLSCYSGFKAFRKRIGNPTEATHKTWKSDKPEHQCLDSRQNSKQRGYPISYLRLINYVNTLPPPHHSRWKESEGFICI